MEISLIFSAFIAGLLTFLAPCTLPLVPGYIGFISGASAEDLQNPKYVKSVRWRIFKNGLWYVIGFSSVFILLGSFFGAISLGLSEHKDIFARVGGVFVLFLGLYMMGLHKLKVFSFLQREHKLSIVSKLKPGKPSSSFLLGATFAFAWTPCVGPVLGAVLTLALTQASVWYGTFLLSVFSFGLAIPFLLVAYGYGTAVHYIKKISKYLNVVSFIGGLFFVFIGILLITDYLIIWNSFAYKIFSFINYQGVLDLL